MNFPRSSGVLLHPTSLPGRYGIGDLGAEAYKFIDFLAESRQSLWQVMPLGPTSFGDSPYQCLSSCAGNPMLVSPDKLVVDGFIPQELIGDVPQFSSERVEYGKAIEWKNAFLWRCFEHFRHSASDARKRRFEAWCRDNAYWLEDYALFKALKDHFDGKVWNTWEHDIATHQPHAVRGWGEQLGEQVWAQRFFQFLFAYQWRELKGYANDRGVRVIGDIPIFVAMDSADAWANPELFWLDEDGKPISVAGVPPDYFSATGQLWGNPLYRWETMGAHKYKWWILRFRAVLSMVDIIRIDHFRGFESCWEVPATEPTAVNGRWVKVPGADLFQTVLDTMGYVPIIAEDLGVITAEVRKLRDRFGFPTMKILQFGFEEGPESLYLPHNFVPNSVVYTGTHDNDTTRGWFASKGQREKEFTQRYLARDGHDIAWDLIRTAFASVSRIAIVPLQDILDLGSEARMNRPSVASGNWDWRFRSDQIHGGLVGRLREVTLLYGRAQV